MEGRTKHAVVLLSGGLDSATALAIARADGFACHALTVGYGQRHAAEIAQAALVAAALGAVEHKTVALDLRWIGGSALTADIPVPKGGVVAGAIPVTYVPARNTILLSLALAWAEVLGTRDLFIGVTAVDYSGYPDCRPAFIEAFERLANTATRAGVTGSPFAVHAPLISMNKAQIIRKGIELGVDYAATTSCYDPDAAGRACGLCDACRLRRKGFTDAGVADPTRYQHA
ncbi:7-cyano-7-deazaguanine synthase QueC [bacterium]|nr:7-cyano-7-deazaguanine synthase QueC [bacterium]